jgi:DNA-binding beta-propeller fold protein YncE
MMTAIAVVALAVAGCGVAAGGASDLPASMLTAARMTADAPDALRCPSGLAVNGDGTLMVVDTGHERLVRLSAGGRVLDVWERGRSGARSFRFSLPPDDDVGPACLGAGQVAVDADGTLLVADLVRVRRLDRTGEVVAAWSTTGPDGSPFQRPAGIAVDRQTGHVYVADSGDARIHVFDRDGRWLRAWGGRPWAGALTNPAGLATDALGRLYVADRGAHHVWRYSRDGLVEAMWGGRGLAAGEFVWPRGVAVDRSGRVYVVDTERVQVFSDDGVSLAAWSLGDGSAIPGGIAVDDAGTVYVSDMMGGVVRQYRPREPWPLVVGTATPRPAPTPFIPVSSSPVTVVIVMTPTDR